jgi:hypothetical protein
MINVASKNFLSETHGKIRGTQRSRGYKNEGSLPLVETAFPTLHPIYSVKNQLNFPLKILVYHLQGLNI